MKENDRNREVAAQVHSKSLSPPSDTQPRKKIKDMTEEEKRE